MSYVREYMKETLVNFTVEEIESLQIKQKCILVKI